MTPTLGSTKPVLVTAAFAACLISCSTSSTTSATQDASLNRWDQVAVGKPDLGTDIPSIIPDQGPPRALVRISSPSHLTTNLDPQVKVEFIVTLYGIETSLAEQHLKKAVSLKTLNGLLDVAGLLDFRFSEHRLFFSPTNPLGKDADYVASVTENQYVKSTDDNRSVFRVGSLPRVREVGFVVSSKNPAHLGRIIVAFSEGISQSAAISVTKVRDTVTGQEIAISSTAVAGLQAYLHVDLTNGYPKDKSIDLEIGVDVGVPSKLDGFYTGVAGSGSFKATLVPDKHMKTTWQPSF